MKSSDFNHHNDRLSHTVEEAPDYGRRTREYLYERRIEQLEAALHKIESDLEGACRVLPGIVATMQSVTEEEQKTLAAFTEMLGEIWSEASAALSSGTSKSEQAGRATVILTPEQAAK